MKKRLLALLLCLCPLLPGIVAGAEELTPGQLVSGREHAAREAGLELRTDTTFAWGGLPLLEEDTNKTLKSLLGVLALRTRRHEAEGSGYAALDVLLQDVSVLDFSMQALDGVYYEQSNLLGGQVVAFTPEEFRTFVARLSTRSGGAIPTNFDMLFGAVMRALGGGDLAIDQNTLDGALSTFLGWSAQALVPEERLRPKLYIPGLYGTRSMVTDVTREEAISLAQAYSSLLAENEALWTQAVQAQMPDGDEETLHETAAQVAEWMRALPQTLTDILPDDLPPAEFREVYDANDALVARQMEVTLPKGEHIYCEWVPRAEGIRPLYLSVSVGGSALELIITREDGQPQATRREAKLQNRLLATWTYIEPTFTLDGAMTRTENTTTTLTRENWTIKTEWTMESEALFGPDAVITLSQETTGRASGDIGANYSRREETVYRLKGLGFDRQKLLTVTSRTTMRDPASPFAADIEPVRPATFDDEALNTWLDGTRTSLLQVWYTVLGRLPPDVARYVLARME